MFIRRFTPAFACLFALLFCAASADAGGHATAPAKPTMKISTPKKVIKPIPRVIVNPPDRNAGGNSSTAKPMPRIVTPKPSTQPSQARSGGRPDPTPATSTSGTLAYKYVCQARREWCYVNASKPIPADTNCYCGDLEGKTTVMK